MAYSLVQTAKNKVPDNQYDCRGLCISLSKQSPNKDFRLIRNFAFCL